MARWWRIELYRLTGRLDEAVADCDTAIEQRPEDADFISVQAEIFYAMGRHEAARAGFAKAIKIDPGLADQYGHHLTG